MLNIVHQNLQNWQWFNVVVFQKITVLVQEKLELLLSFEYHLVNIRIEFILEQFEHKSINHDRKNDSQGINRTLSNLDVLWLFHGT